MQPEDASFSQRVFHIVAAIPYGKVTTYGEVARLAGSPRAARQVGGVLRRLPEGSTLPWHRVINRHGQISQQGGFSTATASIAGGGNYFRPAQHGRFRSLWLALVKQNSLWPKHKGC